MIELDEFGQLRLPALSRLLDAYTDLEATLKGLAAEKSFAADGAKSTEPAEGEPANLNA